MSLSESEANFLRHMTRFGSDGYPVEKASRGWLWVEWWGIKGAPTVYKTKREAVAAIERYIEILGDKKAGRLS